MLHTASANFIHAEKLLEEVDDLEEETYDATLMAVARAIISGF